MGRYFSNTEKEEVTETTTGAGVARLPTGRSEETISTVGT
jgi:hypothetical protein